jgi:hypothetical protein
VRERAGRKDKEDYKWGGGMTYKKWDWYLTTFDIVMPRCPNYNSGWCKAKKEICDGDVSPKLSIICPLLKNYYLKECSNCGLKSDNMCPGSKKICEYWERKVG